MCAVLWEAGQRQPLDWNHTANGHPSVHDPQSSALETSPLVHCLHPVWEIFNAHQLAAFEVNRTTGSLAGAMIRDRR